jgi:hypothetical protein
MCEATCWDHTRASFGVPSFLLKQISHLRSNFFPTAKFLYPGIYPVTFCILIYVAIQNNEMKRCMLIKLYNLPRFSWRNRWMISIAYQAYTKLQPKFKLCMVQVRLLLCWCLLSSVCFLPILQNTSAYI